MTNNKRKKDDITEEAKTFAISAHESLSQKRKYTGEPYHIHCERVVKILCEITTDNDMLAAAWMHDILEDVTPLNPTYSEEKIRELFGDRICDMVVALTDTKLIYGNRASRKAKDKLRLEVASYEVKTIKLADLLDNFIDIKTHDPGFAKVFARETELLLPSLADGNTILFSKVSALLNEFKSGSIDPLF